MPAASNLSFLLPVFLKFVHFEPQIAHLVGQLVVIQMAVSAAASKTMPKKTRKTV